MVIDPVLGSVAITRATEVEWNALHHQKRFPYNFEERKIVTLPAESPAVRRSASIVKVREGRRSKVWPKYREESVNL